MQELFPSDLPARETFALELFLVRMKVGKEWPWKILWTDEAHSHLLGYVNRIAEYGQQKIHSKLNLYHFFLQRSVCNAGLRYHLS